MRASTLIAAVSLAAATLGGCVMLRARSEHGRLVAALPPEAQLAGWEQCVDCHTTIADWYAASFHASNPGCETCHGPGDLHVSDGPGNIVGEDALEKLSPRGRSEMCATCHRDRAVDWPHGDHARGGLACADCHTDAVHFRQDDAVRAPGAFATGVDAVHASEVPGVLPPGAFPVSADFCTQCHAASAAEFEQPFHHPVPEGAIGCADCHDPHGAQVRRPELAAREGCSTCHAEQSGPKVFRHAALDEGCSVCHVPHGSPLQAMLAQDGNGICLQCHQDASFPVIEGVDHSQLLAQEARCWDCHVENHGSNSDPTFLGRLR